MIWIATIILIVIAAWFIVEGLNERGWVQDHLDDETVAADKGYLSKYDELKSSPMPEERYSVHKADNRVGRFAAKAKEKTASLGDAVERRATTGQGGSGGSGDANLQAKRQQRAVRGQTMTGPDSFIGRTSQRLSEKTDRIGEMIPEGRMVSDSRDGDQPPSRVRRYLNSITDRLDRIDEQVKQS